MKASYAQIVKLLQTSVKYVSAHTAVLLTLFIVTTVIIYGKFGFLISLNMDSS